MVRRIYLTVEKGLWGIPTDVPIDLAGWAIPIGKFSIIASCVSHVGIGAMARKDQGVAIQY